MSEESPEAPTAQVSQAEAAASFAPPTTGLAEVDEALAEVAQALREPVAMQVPAVERAHERLRRALETVD